MRLCQLNCVAILLACSFAGIAEGNSFGRWRLPSTTAQFFGCGYGPGHHAPMVRMPRCDPMDVQRLTFVAPCQQCSPNVGSYWCPAPAGVCYSQQQPIPSGPQIGCGCEQPTPVVPYRAPQQLFSPPGKCACSQEGHVDSPTAGAGLPDAENPITPTPVSESLPSPGN